MSVNLRNMYEMFSRALKSREDIYKGQGEARQAAFAKGTRVKDEIYAFMQSVQAKELIADNQWNMQQCNMYANLAHAELLEQVLQQQRVTNEFLSELIRVLEVK